MANLLENYGLGFFENDENALMGFVGYLAEKGKCKTGYSGTPYIYKSMGDVEFWIETEINEENQNLNITEIHTHCSGNCILDVVHSGIDITPEDSSYGNKVVMFNSTNGQGGMIPINIINSDILPSFIEGDKIKVQVVAQPLDINYYSSEEEYEGSQPSLDDGRKFMIANGSMLPLHFMGNHSVDNENNSINDESDQYVTFTATVKGLYYGKFKMEDDEDNTFIRCIAETEFGEMMFCHTIEQVAEEQQDNIKVGSIIHGVCILSGDVAIYDYNDGLVKDFNNDLLLMKHTLVTGEANRLRSVLSVNATYETSNSEVKYNGIDEIINRLLYVVENKNDECFGYLATITESEDKEFPAGTRCVVLAYNERDNYESIVFIDVNDEGEITRIKITNDSSFSFMIDEEEKTKTPFDDITPPENVYEPIINRAKFHSIIDCKLDYEEILNDISDYAMLERNVTLMLKALEENPQPDAETALENIMGYLFAKTMEYTINTLDNKIDNMQLIASYNPEEAFKGEISSKASDINHKKLVKAMELGKQFFKDFSFFIQLNELSDDDFTETFKKAAVVVQRIGQLGAIEYFNE